MKQILIKGCMDDVCPFFKRTKHYDYNDELTCIHPSHEFKKTMRDSDDYEMDFNEKRELVNVTLPANCGEEGLFPSFCPLEDKS